MTPNEISHENGPENGPKKKRKLSVDHLILVASAIALLVAGFFFFRDGSLQLENHNDLLPVGKIAVSRNDVRRRLDTGFSWGAAEEKMKVFEGDSIFTGVGSDASIDLDGGGKINIGAKSLVVIRTQNNRLRLDLQYGSLNGKVAGNQPILISENGRLQEITSDDAEVQIESVGEETKIRVIKGKVKVKPMQEKPAAAPKAVAAFAAPKSVEPEVKEVEPVAGAAEHVIEVNQIAAFEEKKAVPEIRRVKVESVYPNDGQTIWLAPGKNQQFTWKFIDPNEKGPVKIELSDDPEFKKPFQTVEASGVSYELTQEQLGNGAVHWRVLSAKVGDTSLPSASRTLTTYPDVPPRLTFPANEQEFAYNAVGGEKGKQLQLTWEDTAGSTGFQLQIANEAEFKKPLVDKKLGKVNSESTDVFPAGTYYWRMQGLNALRTNSPWSSVQSFKIDEDAKMPDVPVMLTKAINYTIPKTVLARAPRSASIEKGPGVHPDGIQSVSWNAASHAESYEVEISKNSRFDNSLKTDVTGVTQFTPQEVLPGQMFVRVRAKGKRGLTSEPSTATQITVGLPAPELAEIPPVTEKFKTPAELAAAKHDFDLKWSPVAYAETYELEWGSDTQFTQSKKFRLRGNERKMNVTKDMAYTARVRALGPGAVPLSPYSNVAMTNYTKQIEVPPPPPPVKTIAPLAKAKLPGAGGSARNPATVMRGPKLLLPQRNSSFVSLENATSYVSFRWAQIKSAKTYDVELASDADFSNVIDRFTAKSTAYTFKKQLPEGHVFWRVRAKVPNGISEWSDVYDLNVLYD